MEAVEGGPQRLAAPCPQRGRQLLGERCLAGGVDPIDPDHQWPVAWPAGEGEPGEAGDEPRAVELAPGLGKRIASSRTG
ncbi:MAG: hypothetical protein ABSA31_06690 [Acidimicrobiales bacterium]